MIAYCQSLSAFLLFVATACNAADWNGFVRAIHLTESGGKVGAILSDGGRALGPLAIHRAYWTDARQPGSYGDVTNLACATATMRAYLQRYAPAALAAGESANQWQEAARIHNGGPNGNRRKSTIVFWKKVEAKL